MLGPTATGKSALALEVARRHPDVELVNLDSMQVYRGMDIGTAKPTAAERLEVPHHLLDLVDPAEEFSLARFQAAVRSALASIEARGHRALLVGGTGLYVRAVVDDLQLPGRFPDTRAALDAEPDTTSLHRRLAELDPVAAGRMEATNRRRVVRALEVTLGSGRPFSSFGPGLDAHPASPLAQVGLRLPLHVLDARIARRFRAMLDAGLLDEVRHLLRRPGGLSRTARQALGYRELAAHLEGQCSLEEAGEEAVRRTRRFARRQLRWFRRDPRITWVDAGENPLAVALRLLGDCLQCG
ncbi:MAG: tRNA (adenosine(37)-N6)-dimethylallyltransferase MiaA [Actinomycetota bacterium]|nr:tRNA (adenosine(37)-N6)-dimethylallyltransferase MiaA [Actinomycetota bacterium]